jgi:hypothetical protein
MLTGKGVLLLLAVVLSTGALLHFLTNEGETSMSNAMTAGGVTTAKPPIDENIPDRIETATFALG